MHGAPLYFVPSIFCENLKTSKIEPIVRGHSSARGSKFEKKIKRVGGFFVLNAQKNLCAILTTATPSKPLVQVTIPPKNVLKSLEFWRVGGSLIGFGNKVVAVNKLGFPDPLIGEIWGVKLIGQQCPLREL